ncbi:MAG: hypothetical protein PHX39_08120, partial [Bacteroidales bacterium]|nr:hypothetical protein [Bacteroidales bacterium]
MQQVFKSINICAAGRSTFKKERKTKALKRKGAERETKNIGMNGLGICYQLFAVALSFSAIQTF